MLPKDTPKRFLDGPFQCEELRNRVSAYVGEMLAGQDASGGAISTSPKEMTKMSMQCNSAIRLIGPTGYTSKSPTMSENPSTVGLPTRHHQHHANRPHETRNRGVKKKLLINYKCGGKGHPARLCPTADDCQDVDEVGTEPSSDADSDLER